MHLRITTFFRPRSRLVCGTRKQESECLRAAWPGESPPTKKKSFIKRTKPCKQFQMWALTCPNLRLFAGLVFVVKIVFCFGGLSPGQAARKNALSCILFLIPNKFHCILGELPYGLPHKPSKDGTGRSINLEAFAQTCLLKSTAIRTAPRLIAAFSPCMAQLLRVQVRPLSREDRPQPTHPYVIEREK